MKKILLSLTSIHYHAFCVFALCILISLCGTSTTKAQCPFNSVTDCASVDYTVADNNLTVDLAQPIPSNNDLCIGRGCGEFTFTNIISSLGTNCPTVFTFGVAQGCGGGKGNVCLFEEDCTFLESGDDVFTVEVPAGLDEYTIRVCRPGNGPVNITDLTVTPAVEIPFVEESINICNTVDDFAYDVFTDFGIQVPDGLTASTDPTSITGMYDATTGSDYKVTITYTRASDGCQESFCVVYRSSDAVDCILPVELKQFEADAIGNEVILTWQTASELDNVGFEIERSKDAQDWQTLSFVKGNGTTIEAQRYKWVDISPYSTTNYYRLKQLDSDGTSEYSSVLAVDLEKKLTEIQLLSNIVRQTIELSTSFEDEQEYTIELYDMAGRSHQTITTRQASMSIDANDLYDGLHVLIIRSGNQVYFKRFIKI